MAAALALALPQEAEARQVFERVAPSVVAVRNDEGHGSGMILDAQGHVLTNAHVIVSPLPTRVEVDAVVQGRRSRLSFRRVALVGVHPRLDMAILKIDPAEHGVTLAPVELSKAAARFGERLYAVGFPGDVDGGHRKMIAGCTLKSVERVVDMAAYQVVVGDVVEGNSGGPLCDAAGKVVGIITLGGVELGEPVAAALPLQEFRPALFVPLRQRETNPGKAAGYLRAAERALSAAQKRGPGFVSSLSVACFHLALQEDFANPAIHYKIGMLYRNTDRDPLALPYLVRALQLRPWGDFGADGYHELGVALAKLRRKDEALIVWREGLAKYPAAPILWDALATHYWNSKNPLEAAYCSRAALKGMGPRGQTMNSIYQMARGRLTPEETVRLRGREEGLDDELARRKAAAEEGRRLGREFFSPEAERLIRDFEGVLKLAAEGRRPEGGPKDNADERTAKIIRLQTQAAIGYLEQGKRDRALDLFEEILREYPDHPESATARSYLSALKP